MMGLVWWRAVCRDTGRGDCWDQAQLRHIMGTVWQRTVCRGTHRVGVHFAEGQQLWQHQLGRESSVAPDSQSQCQRLSLSGAAACPS